MKHYDKEPIEAKDRMYFDGTPSKALKKFRTEDAKSSTKKIRNTTGNYMYLPKSSWSNTQNSPPQVQWGQANEQNA